VENLYAVRPKRPLAGVKKGGHTTGNTPFGVGILPGRDWDPQVDHTGKKHETGIGREGKGRERAEFIGSALVLLVVAVS